MTEQKIQFRSNRKNNMRGNIDMFFQNANYHKILNTRGVSQEKRSHSPLPQPVPQDPTQRRTANKALSSKEIISEDPRSGFNNIYHKHVKQQAVEERPKAHQPLNPSTPRTFQKPTSQLTTQTPTQTLNSSQPHLTNSSHPHRPPPHQPLKPPIPTSSPNVHPFVDANHKNKQKNNDGRIVVDRAINRIFQEVSDISDDFDEADVAEFIQIVLAFQN